MICDQLSDMAYKVTIRKIVSNNLMLLLRKAKELQDIYIKILHFDLLDLVLEINQFLMHIGILLTTLVFFYL